MGALVLLRIPAFSRLLASYFVNELGDTFGAIALAILVFDRTGDALATAGLFVTARFVPALIAPALTARVDQRPLRGTLSAFYLVEAAVFAGLAVLASHFHLAAILALVLADGVLALTARGLTRGAIASTLGTGPELRDGNALMNGAFAVASVGGAAGAGALVAVTGVQVALWCDAASFALVAVLLWTCLTLPRVEGEPAAVWTRLLEGLTYVRRTPFVRNLLGVQAVALVLFTLSVPVEVIYAKQTLDAGDAGLGVLMAAWGTGMVLGSGLYVLAGRLGAVTVVALSTALVGLGYLGMGLVRDLAAAVAFSIVGGTGNGIQWISVVTLLQQRTPPELQARVSGLLESLGAAMPGAGFLLGGVLTSVTSAPTTFVVAGIGLLALVAIGAPTASLRPRRRPAAPSGGA